MTALLKYLNLVQNFYNGKVKWVMMMKHNHVNVLAHHMQKHTHTLMRRNKLLGTSAS